MADDFHASGRENAFSPAEPPRPFGPSLAGLKPGDWPQNYGSSLPSELPTPNEGLNTNPNPHQPFHGRPPQHPPWLPTQMSTRSTTSAVIPASTAGLFQGGSDNALHNSTASMANRDMWNLSNVHIHLPHASHGGQGSPSLPQLLRQPFSIFSYVLSIFATLIPHTAVTLDSQQYEAPYTIMPSDPSLPANSRPDPNVLGSESDGTLAADAIPSQAEAVSTEFGNLEITLLDDLDMSARHQPRAWYRSPDLPGGLSLDGIYIKKIYPSGHGYPCPNPCPLGPPVRIGDIGELTSTGFTTLANLFDCQLPVLQSQLASLALSDVWQEPEYFSEGESITGGVSVQNINHLSGSRVIQDITYRCHAPQGAVLAVTSPAQLHTLAGDKTHRLRLWLCKHGMELLQFVDPGRTDPLYVVTGKVTSSSWASATYSEPLPEPDSSLVLTRFLHDLPPYQWTKPGTARSRSKSSSTVINPQGERASDQCLFLRGFLLTPALGYTSSQVPQSSRIGNTIPDPTPSKSHKHMDIAGGASERGSSQLTHFFHPSGQSGGMAKGSEENGLLVEDIPSLSSMDFYPSHRINKRLLELTNADLAITHDDDWRLGLEGPSLLDLQGTEGGVPGKTELSAEDVDPVIHAHQDQQTSSGKQEGVSNWGQEVSKSKPLYPDEESTDSESDFYNRSKYKILYPVAEPNVVEADFYNKSKEKRLYSAAYRNDAESNFYSQQTKSSTQSKSSPSHRQRKYNTNVEALGSSNDDGRPDPGRPQYHQPQPPPPTIFSSVTSKPLIPVFNLRTQAYDEQSARSNRPPRSSRKSRKRENSAPPRLGQVDPGEDGFVYREASQTLLSAPLSGPYSGNQPTTSMPEMYRSWVDTSSESLDTLIQRQDQQGRAAVPVALAVSGVSLPTMHMRGYGQQQKPMMVPPRMGTTATHSGYHATGTYAEMGYLSAGKASTTSGGAQPWATVVVDSKKDQQREKGKNPHSSSLFAKLARIQRKRQ
ncbi:hypothetical protein BKA70DRAFT_1558832 [Coprinopsis sp. MPI-PUGE-AT-0042]|nr:hypothetical protein BKA70DRAFT_1558832 [Coprinopsis sp. MPI-PUGE-AT-0042]